jgi:hypothetical protein
MWACTFIICIAIVAAMHGINKLIEGHFLKLEHLLGRIVDDTHLLQDFHEERTGKRWDPEHHFLVVEDLLKRIIDDTCLLEDIHRTIHSKTENGTRNPGPPETGGGSPDWHKRGHEEFRCPPLEW